MENDEVMRLIDRSDDRDEIINPIILPRPRRKKTIRGRLSYDKIVFTPLNLRPRQESPCMFLSKYDSPCRRWSFSLETQAVRSGTRTGLGTHPPGSCSTSFAQYQPAKGVDVMRFVEVVGTAGAAHRRRHWNIPGQGRRKVLRLSQK